MFELHFIKLATLAQQPTANWQMENGKYRLCLQFGVNGELCNFSLAQIIFIFFFIVIFKFFV